MQLSSGTQIPDGLLAAMTLLSEKPRLGVPSKNPAPNQGINEANSTAAIGLRAGLLLNRVQSRYTGKERDAESGLDYFGARYYNSATGRWISPDSGPAGVALANPQSWNLYICANNNPMRFTDPNGRWVTDIHAAIVTYALQDYVSAGELNELRARQYSMDADQSDQSHHAMANKGQSSNDALDAMWHFVSTQMGIVAQNNTNGSLSQTGLDALGDAMHTLQDWTSPMHTDANFMPKEWTGGTWPPSGWGPGLSHVSGEESPSQDWSRIGFAVRLSMAALLQSGKSCEAGRRCLTAGNFESEFQTNISNYVNNYYEQVLSHVDEPAGATPGSFALSNESARQCAMGNPAACNP